ncbi:MAG: hypothetical protein KC550_01200 [Nanoarchaeota archaeon]|nr:hypothetical protein [Nanoarchaeota archaeon]
MSHKRDLSGKEKKTNSKKNNHEKDNELVQIEDEQISGKDVNLIEESFNIIKNLNTQVIKVEKGKEKLQKDLSKLHNRLEKHEKNTKQNFESKFFLKIKEDIIAEFAPLLNKIDYKSLKVDMFKELAEILEIEVNKLKKDLSSKTNKISKESKKKFTELEMRIIDSIKSSEGVKKNLDKTQEKDLSKLFIKLEEKVYSIIEKNQRKSQSQFKSKENELEMLSSALVEQKIYSENLDKKLNEFRNEVKKVITSEDMDVSSIVSKIQKIDEDNKAIKSLIERYENDLYNRKKSETLEVEKKVKQQLDDLSLGLKEIRSDKIEIEKFVVKKTNAIIDTINLFEKKLIKVENEKPVQLEKKFSEKFNSFKEETHEALKDTISDMSKTIHKKIESSINDFSSEKNIIQEDLDNFKSELSNLVKNYAAELDSELKDVQKKASVFSHNKTRFKEYLEGLYSENLAEIKSSLAQEKELLKKSLSEIKTQGDGQKDFIVSKYNEIVDTLSKAEKGLETKVNIEINKLKKEFDKVHEKSDVSKKNFISKISNEFNENSAQIDNKFKNILDEIKIEKESMQKQVSELEKQFSQSLEKTLIDSKEQISKEILNLSDFLTRITTENKEDKRNFQEEIENKLVSSKQQFEAEFNSHLLSFDTQMKEKEAEFLEKLQVIETEKNEMVNDLNVFKTEISCLTKDYVSKLDEEVQNIKTHEADFESKKKDFISHIDTLTSIRKTEMEDFSKQLENKLVEVLTNQKETFETHENTFRELFSEKLNNLQEFQKKKLESIEKKFIEKNLRIIKETVDTEKKALEIIKENLESKSLELDKRVEAIEAKEDDFYKELEAEETKLNERVESRLTQLEKQFNRRFLDYDSDFSDFKGVIVDEVEGLMKDVTTLVDNKVENFDKNITKLNFINNEAANRINDLNKLSVSVETQIGVIRENVNDIKIKQEIMEPIAHSLNEHVIFMSEYENQLIALIKNLKNRGVPHNSIAEALVNKGHPRFYVMMILENFEEILNK